jgi:hypothetical protein
MAATTLEVLGTVRADGTLELDTRLALKPGRVKVLVEALEPPPAPAESLVEFGERSRRELEAAGHRFRTKEEIDGEIAELRNEWDGRLEEIERSRSSESE